jgi:glycosyltransferase involved in cell wall biosynthesis
MISVIIPAYNAEKSIGACLSSLQDQVKKPDEIIVVDDGSRDGTALAVSSFKEVDLIKQTHKGPAAARNAGAKKAKGNILLFTDSDCVPDKNWVSEMAKPFENSEVAGVQGRYRTEQRGAMARFVQLEIEDRYDRMRKRKYIDFIGSYSAGYLKDVFIKYGGFDESFPMASGEDPEISFKLAKAGHKMVFNEKAVVGHNHVESLGAYLKQKFWRAFWRVHLYRKHISKIAGESYTPQTLKIQIILLGAAFLSIIASVFSSQFLMILAATILLLFIATLPLSLKNMKKSVKVGIMTPFISILRTFVFVLGLTWGVMKI